MFPIVLGPADAKQRWWRVATKTPVLHMSGMRGTVSSFPDQITMFLFSLRFPQPGEKYVEILCRSASASEANFLEPYDFKTDFDLLCDKVVGQVTGSH
jgi:hypothetical protein